MLFDLDVCDGIRTANEVLKRHLVQRGRNSVTHLRHRMTNITVVRAGAIAARLVGIPLGTADRGKWSIQDPGSLADKDFGGRARKTISAPGAFLRAQQAGLTKFQ